MKLQQIDSTKIKHSDFFNYIDTSKKTIPPLDSYEPLKVCKQKENYLLVDGYHRYQNNKKKWQCLVFEQKDFFFLWEARLLDKFYNNHTHWIKIGQMLQEISIYLQKPIVEIWKNSQLQFIIPSKKLLDILLEMLKRRNFLLQILPAKSWTIQNYKTFQKLSDKELQLLIEKFTPFGLNYGQYKQVLEIFYDVKRIKKTSIANLLEQTITPDMSFSDLQKKLYYLRNPFASKFFLQRKKALQKIKLPIPIKISYSDNLEKPSLYFSYSTKNFKDWQKLLHFFQNDIIYLKKEIENLYQFL